jgi:hypothetical protein
MPLIYEWINATFTNQQLVDLALKFNNPAAQIQALQTLKQAHVWVPLTLQGNGMFHVAFGAILGVAAFTRGQEKVAWASVGLQPGGYMPVGQGYSQPYGGMGGMNGMGGMYQQPAYNPMGMGMGGEAIRQRNAYNNQTPKAMKPSPAVDAGPSLDVANPDDTTNE